jgi:hypothetical protein
MEDIIKDDEVNEEIDTSTETPVLADSGIPQDVADVISGVHQEIQDSHEEELEDDDTNTDDDDLGDDSVATEDKVDDEVDLDVLGYDAETIQKLRDIDPNILKDIKGLISATNLDDEVSEEAVEEVAKLDSTENVVTGGLTEEQLTDLEKDNPQMAAVIRTLNSQVGLLTNSLNTVAEADKARSLETENRQHVSNYRSANKKLDEISKDFPILGEFDKLPHRDNVPDMRNRSVQERAGIWNYAQKLHSGGVTDSFEDALDDSIALYKAKNAKNLAMREVSKELRGKAKKFTNRPTSKKTRKKEPKPGTDAHKISVVRDAMKKAGVPTG